MPRYENREEILADWLNGMTGEELAKKHGCSKYTGSSLAWARGLKRSAKVKKMDRAKNSARVKAHHALHPRQRHDHEKVADFVSQHGIAAAAAEFNYCEDQVRIIAQKFGWVNPKKLNKAAIIRAYLAGVPIAKIVKKHGCDASYPTTMAKRMGKTRNPELSNRNKRVPKKTLKGKPRGGVV